jgi:5-methyltetrahydropteroyltriglutamate--homocysteine methyltransferase
LEAAESRLNLYKEQAKLLTIKELEDAGIDIITDGEQGRTSFYEYLTEQLTGFTMDAPRPGVGGSSRSASLRMPEGKVEFRGEVLAAREAEFLKAHTRKPGKVAIIAPNFLGRHWRAGGYYPTPDALMDAMVRVGQEEARALARTGIQYIQWDAPSFSRYTEPSIPRAEASRLMRDEVSVLNSVIQSASYPAGTVKALHLCWGNYKSMHLRDGPLKQILPELLDIKVDLLLLELASASHEDDVDALKEHPPSGKMIGAGVIDVHTPDIEPVWLVKKRASRVLKHVDADKLLLTTDCGFAPTWDSDLLPRSSCFMKLRSLVMAAEELRNSLTAA